MKQEHAAKMGEGQRGGASQEEFPRFLGVHSGFYHFLPQSKDTFGEQTNLMWMAVRVLFSALPLAQRRC